MSEPLANGDYVSVSSYPDVAEGVRVRLMLQSDQNVYIGVMGSADALLIAERLKEACEHGGQRRGQ